MPVKKVLVSADKEGAGAAGRVKNPERRRLLRGLAFKKFPDRVFYDVVHDVGRGVKDAARRLHFGLVLYLCLVPGSEPDHLAKELLVDLPYDVRREHGEGVRTVRVVETAYDLLQGFIVNFKAQGDVIRALFTPLFCPEMEKAGIVPVVGFMENLAEPPVNIIAVQIPLKPAILFDTPVFADTQEDKPVNGPLY